MRNLLLIIGVIVLNIFSKAQTVENITAQQDGNNINIYYHIDNTNNNQLFRVIITCLVNNDQKIIPQNITGDVGDNIKGGKEEYKAVWNVLQDLDELTNANFFVKIELIEESTTHTQTRKKAEKKWFVAFNSAPRYTPIGFRLGYIKNWGGYIAYRAGYGSGYSTISNYVEWDDEILQSPSIGIIKRVINKNEFKLHTYLGIGHGTWGYYKSEVWIDNSENPPIERYHTTEGYDGWFVLEYGLIFSYKRIIFSFGPAHNIGDDGSRHDFVFGLGYLFF